ncbi:signal transduction histidine kinase [Mobilisporobacter senegalensis]|uniref:histidine kinase n=1 Tax=Mobilisporobacter senegalensis TaxID=1329262 RepID=A0A3N1X4P5_9FIRM|nr:signal transduction histidine kinase [Mobilisporobacter senegalensis]
MNHKIIELIRQILIKTILPLRKKREEFLSNFRFSIVFRISLNYFRLLIFYGALFMVLFSLLFLGMETNHYLSIGDNLVKGLTASHPQLEDTLDSYGDKNHTINPYKDQGLNLRITNLQTKELLYNDIDFDITDKKSFFHHIFYDKGKSTNGLIFYTTRTYEINENNYNVYFQFNLTENSMDLMHLLPGMILIYLFIVYLILHSGKKGNAKLFSIMKTMSATANRLTVNNLHSERLNVAGTKSELKDLAITINGMLDRIETSYESQKQFVSDASHELRTPISVIQGYANLLNRWGKKDETVMEEAIEAIQIESKEMQDLVEKLLFLSRHDKKTLKLKKAKFNMCEIVEDMVKETKLVITNRIIRSSKLEDVIVYGDKQALKQAIRVFIDNAVKYTKDNDVIQISCENQDGDCVITVSDTGIGMTRKDIDNIFERFYRSDHVRNEKISGNGLGLSIAKLIILKHTGRIKVRSQYTKGSTFIITIPKRIY